MKNIEDLITILEVPTSKFSSHQIQEVLLHIKRVDISDTNHWNDLLGILWHHLQSGLSKLDDQLLCATCFYLALSRADNDEHYLEKIYQVITDEINLKQNDKKSSNIILAISLMYGIFQSSYLTQKEDYLNIEKTLQATFNLLMLLAYEYSKYTFIAFKIISSFKKVCEIKYLKEITFCTGNQIILLNLTNHNWENPITGVRELNKDIFRTLISMLDKDIYDAISEEINIFYWNKAKYLMLAEIIEHSECQKSISKYMEDWVDGLINSLHKPGLVSAGTDMYHSMLNKIKSEEEWCHIFLNSILKVLNGSSAKAIENFNNYWCLTTLKRFTSLFRLFLVKLYDCGDSEHKLLSIMHVIKQANKLGLVIKNWEDRTEIEEFVLNGLDHYKSQIRVLAFEIICISHSKSMPTKVEYELIIKFLHDNVNSDCTVLRISMLNNFGAFLTQAHINFINNVRKDEEVAKEDLYDFCIKVQYLIISCLKVNVNYQRKLTIIKIAKLFMKNLAEVPNKRKKQTRLAIRAVTEILKTRDLLILMKDEFISKLVELLNDHSEDIRDNVIELLLDHYLEYINKESFINSLMKSAWENVGSKFFYSINCGHNKFKLISSILLNNRSQINFKGVQELLEFVWREFLSEYKLKRGVVESIEKGKQLHSLMVILQVIFEVCYKNSTEFKIPEPCNLLECLEVLENISNQFAWEEDNSISSDFAKMSDMVERLIDDSDFKPRLNNDETKISGLHQTVLNCLWLNIRASCELSSVIIQFQREESHTVIVNKCLCIITHVLETCRHKGAIEAAGVSLGQAIRYLSSISEDNSLSRLPMDLLKCKLKDLISEASKMASVTRRGAGLSIMVHKMVSNDLKKGKPLFHYFMKSLIKTCNVAVDFPVGLEDSTANERDLPKAIYIHFLTKIVHDSSLASDTMFYSAELAELAFGNLTSPHWQIRNAALQLYGALVPKLIGQKKPSGTGNETIATVACDEFRTHSPQLWIYILRELNNKNHDEKLQQHLNLIPILNILANMARRYSFSYNNTEYDHELLENLILLWNSPIFTVRRLAAKCIFNMYSFQLISNIILNRKGFTENSLHGCLMLTSLYCKLLDKSSSDIDDFKNLQLKFQDILNTGKHSYLSKAIFEEISSEQHLNVDLRRTFKEVDENIHAPGVFLWANGQVEKCVSRLREEDILQCLELILDRNDFENYGKSFLKILENDGSFTKETLLKVTNILVNKKSKWNTCVIWKMLYKISKQIDLSNYLDLTAIVKFLEDNKYPYKLRYSIPFFAKTCTRHEDKDTICMIVHSLTDLDRNDMDMRYIAALALNDLSKKFSSLSDTAKCYVLVSAITLLQDEDEDIRNAVVKLYKTISNNFIAPHPYICLKQILNIKFLKFHLSPSKIEKLCDQIMEYCYANSGCEQNSDFNPFANDSKNIYLEVDILKQLVDNVKYHLVELIIK